MNQASQIWVLGVTVTVMSTILAFVAKLITQQVLKKLDDIIIELQRLSNTSVAQEERLKALKSNQEMFVDTLNDHANDLVNHEIRITKLETLKSN